MGRSTLAGTLALPPTLRSERMASDHRRPAPLSRPAPHRLLGSDHTTKSGSSPSRRRAQAAADHLARTRNRPAPEPPPASAGSTIRAPRTARWRRVPGGSRCRSSRSRRASCRAEQLLELLQRGRAQRLPPAPPCHRAFSRLVEHRQRPRCTTSCVPRRNVLEHSLSRGLEHDSAGTPAAAVQRISVVPQFVVGNCERNRCERLDKRPSRKASCAPARGRRGARASTSRPVRSLGRRRRSTVRPASPAEPRSRRAHPFLVAVRARKSALEFHVAREIAVARSTKRPYPAANATHGAEQADLVLVQAACGGRTPSPGSRAATTWCRSLIVPAARALAN